jgi:hypothetical protein
MKLRNHQIKKLIEFLMSIELVGKQSRMRTRFCKLLTEQLQLIETERIELIGQFGKKDEYGRVIQFEDAEGNMTFDIEDRSKFLDEYNLLMNEFFYIDETMERKEMLLLIRDIILDCNIPFKGDDAITYDLWCEAVEEINYE